MSRCGSTDVIFCLRELQDNIWSDFTIPDLEKAFERVLFFDGLQEN